MIGENVKTLLIAILLLTSTTILASDGPTIFKAQKCVMCHHITGVIEGKGKDIGKKGHKEADIVAFLQKKQKFNGKMHMMPWKGSDAELKTLANWLSQN